MGDSEAESLAKLNQAGEAISEELLRMGFDLAATYASRFGIDEAEMPLALANAYYRVAVYVNSEVFQLDDDELGKRWMQAIKDVARESR